jgi:hypothetical protein
MFRSREAFSSEARWLLENERSVPPLPTITRARALARAGAALGAPRATERLAPVGVPHTIRWASAAGLVFLAAVAGGAAAYELGVRTRPVTTPPAPDARVPLPAPPFRPTAERPSEVLAERWRLPPPSPSKAELTRQELHLLQRARAAVAREDFAAALPPINEHARRFRDGHLAEEREALRVKALSGLGRIAEARRAIATFEARFPRSPLLSAVSQMVDAAP